MNLIEELKERGLVEALTDPEIAKMLEKPTVLYCGFDPSAKSLQAGNLVSIMVLKRFQQAGHKVIALVGGATGYVTSTAVNKLFIAFPFPLVLQKWVFLAIFSLFVKFNNIIRSTFVPRRCLKMYRISLSLNTYIMPCILGIEVCRQQRPSRRRRDPTYKMPAPA